jgi:hypothetical protein
VEDELKDLKKRAGITEAYDPAYHLLLDRIPKAVARISVATEKLEMNDWSREALASALKSLMDTVKEIRRIHQDS